MHSAPWIGAQSNLMKTFECRRGGVICHTKIRGDTEDQVLREAIEHAKKAHGVDLTQSQTLARYALSLIETEEPR
jgi:predicted small metal-binding protein